MEHSLQQADTIVAIATPPGRGGIGIVRLSGPHAMALAQPLLARLQGALEPGRARFCELAEPATGTRLDEAVVTFFQGPRSYTGEDVVELAAHGSPVLLEHLLRLLLAAGARLAAPGEFTERAFLAGRLDLTQAEAVRDLIDAQTLLQAQVAAQQLGGALSRRVAPVKGELVRLIALLEAGIDFAEDDTPVLGEATLRGHLQTMLDAVGPLRRSFEQGRLVSAGATLAIVGRPNAGKSSLFNALLGSERAIVTAEAGTTRDPVHEQISLGGIPLRLVDTAGLREGTGEAERLGIARSREALADADLLLLVLDSTAEVNAEEAQVLAEAAGRKLLVACNKWDLLPEGSALPAGLLTALAQPVVLKVPEVRCSAKTGEGIPQLRAALLRLLGGSAGVMPETPMLTNLRQHEAVLGMEEALGAAAAALEAGMPHEVVLLDLYGALRAADELTGSTTAENVLQLIFSTFCIGK